MNINPDKKFLSFLGKAVLVSLTLYLLYYTIFTAPDTFLTWRDILQSAFQNPLRYLYLFAAVLIPVNWGLEARKWQLLGQKIEYISYKRAYRAVMVGLTLGFITPNRLGDYAGRVLELKSKERLDAIGAIFIGRVCQLAATVAVGSVGLLYFIQLLYWVDYPGVCVSMALLLLVINVVFLSLLYHAKAMVALVAAIKPLKKLVRYVAVMGNYSAGEMSQVLLLSLWRYLVFMLQFILLLQVFNVKLNLLEYMCGVSGTFFLKSVVPSVSLLSDLGVRELSAMYLFGLLGQERLQVLSASLSLWLLNILVPSAVGLIFVLRLRLFRKGEAL
ncbi:lysylphosphatidylglycerol synthase domain-containing protein [Pontibacter harenae]|uniref:lysylphosphatidylglycerol synthase domain-containing protein n=1 Tax=Pontibacter harenae TaxID=2894083 RepID=UPI001E61A390|nr:lysylphosphatidylglycerol synthase domain-containing protein [Pontibacter harenae]MCC9165647.1 flippase-like domain-containing protein [Pontibacter harenae]